VFVGVGVRVGVAVDVGIAVAVEVEAGVGVAFGVGVAAGVGASVAVAAAEGVSAGGLEVGVSVARATLGGRVGIVSAAGDVVGVASISTRLSLLGSTSSRSVHRPNSPASPSTSSPAMSKIVPPPTSSARTGRIRRRLGALNGAPQFTQNAAVVWLPSYPHSVQTSPAGRDCPHSTQNDAFAGLRCPQLGHGFSAISRLLEWRQAAGCTNPWSIGSRA
jgi:hypothetical protein